LPFDPFPKTLSYFPDETAERNVLIQSDVNSEFGIRNSELLKLSLASFLAVSSVALIERIDKQNFHKPFMVPEILNFLPHYTCESLLILKAMSRLQPYQPSLLRFLHSINAMLVISALITGFWVYDTFDGRFGQIPLPRINNIIDIHGTIALTFWLFAPLFVIYSLWLGRQRLAKKESIANLSQVGKPVWWISLQRIMNTMMLVAIALAFGTGKLMDETWLPTGDLTQVAYSLHLTAWTVMLTCLGLHILMSLKVGGLPLLLSMVSLKVRSNDHPKLWWQQVRNRLQ
jgi:hypothetical protein